MTTIVLSIRPEFTDLILNGDKTVELRRVIPASLKEGSVIIIYCTSPIKHIVAVAKVKKVEHRELDSLWKTIGNLSGITAEFFYEYFTGKKKGFGLVLDDVTKLANPIPLEELRRSLDFTPPQSFSYANSELKSRISSAA